MPTNKKSLSLNCMWIPEFPSQNLFLDGSNLLEEFKTKTLDKLSNWKNDLLSGNIENISNIIINYWFDSKLCSLESISNTQKAIQENSLDNSIFLRDINEIQLVQDNIDIFTPVVPIYLRADLLRVIVALQLSLENKNQLFVYSDLNIPSIKINALLDAETITCLDNIGLVLCKNNFPAEKTMAAYGHHPYENSFFIINLAHDKVLKAHEDILVNMVIEFMNAALESGDFKSNRNESEQYVYGSYRAMLEYLYFLNGEASFKVTPIDNIPFNQRRLGHNKSTTIMKGIENYNNLGEIDPKEFFQISPARISTNLNCSCYYKDKPFPRHSYPELLIKDVSKPPSKQYSRKK